MSLGRTRLRTKSFRCGLADRAMGELWSLMIFHSAKIALAIVVPVTVMFICPSVFRAS